MFHFPLWLISHRAKTILEKKGAFSLCSALAHTLHGGLPTNRDIILVPIPFKEVRGGNLRFEAVFLSESFLSFYFCPTLSMMADTTTI